MKKIISLFAVIATFCAMTTSVFAWEITGQVSGEGASMSGTTITAGAEGFVFKYIGDSAQAGGTSTADVSSLVADGWTISEVETAGVWSYKDTDVTQSFTGGKVKVQFANVLDENAAGQPYLMFKATPSADSTFENLTFKVTPMFALKNVGGTGMFKTVTEYTVVKASTPDPDPDPEPTVNITVEGEAETGLTVSGDDAAAELVDQTVLFDLTNAVKTVDSTLTEASRLWVTYTEGENVTKKNYNIFAAVEAEGKGAWNGSSVAFGIVFDPTEGWDADNFSFEIK